MGGCGGVQHPPTFDILGILSGNFAVCRGNLVLYCSPFIQYYQAVTVPQSPSCRGKTHLTVHIQNLTTAKTCGDTECGVSSQADQVAGTHPGNTLTSGIRRLHSVPSKKSSSGKCIYLSAKLPCGTRRCYIGQWFADVLFFSGLMQCRRPFD